MKAKAYQAKWWQVVVMTMTMLVVGATAGHAVPYADTDLSPALPGGTLNPLTVPKFVQPLVIPPVMPKSTVQPNDATGQPSPVAAEYNIAVRQFQQQILPGGQWNVVNGRNDSFGPTTVWSYGRAEDVVPGNFVAPVPLDPNSPLGLTGQGISFNYPAFTVETLSQPVGAGNVPVTVRWINDLVDANGHYLPHLLQVDQTLHWANPAQGACRGGTPLNRTDCATNNPAPYTGPVPIVTHVHGAHVNPESDGYPEAWWLPAANNLTAATNAEHVDYATRGSIYTEYVTNNTVPGSAYYAYENDQPATTIWYHDHSLGMTRLNVYAGPAGFWLIRKGGYAGGLYDQALDSTTGMAATLPGPAPAIDPLTGTQQDPNFDAAYRQSLHEIPIVVQDRSFNADGSLFYPQTRDFFDGFKVPYIGDAQGSDMAPIWNPEAFFNTMVVNGTTWPQLDVDPMRYRFRLLNGCNSRFLNLAMFQVVGPGPDGLMGNADDVLGAEVPFYQIGADQGFLPQVVEVMTGSQTPVNSAIANILAAELAKVQAGLDNEILKVTASYDKEIAKLQAKAAAKPAKAAKFQAKIAKLTAKRDAKILSLTAKRDAKIAALQAKLMAKAFAKKVPGPSPLQAMLMAPAERSDVIVDFSGLAPGTIVRMINTGPDAPFGGFAAPYTGADGDTTGQIMQFVVSANMVTDNSTLPALLAFNPEPPRSIPAAVRTLSLNEEESGEVCVEVDPMGVPVVDPVTNVANTISLAPPADPANAPPFADRCLAMGSYVPMAPKAALLGDFDPLTGLTTPKLWSSAPMTVPLNSTEDWEIYNFTVDGHPIHLHLVRYEIVNREAMNTNLATGAPFDPITGAWLGLSGIIRPPEPNETGYKDTVIAYPAEVTRIRATFDRAGRYVWHCHIVEHEDNEMMLPYIVQ